MKYTIRNSIILLIICLLVIAGFYLASISTVKEVNVLKNAYQENLKILEKLRSQNPNIEEQFKIEFILEEIQEKKLKTGKYILKKEDPIFSYQYFLDICDKFSAKMNFDFNISEKADLENSKFNTYSLTGIAEISSIYQFIYNLEKQYLLYIITDVDISEESTEDKTARYNIVIQAYQSDIGTVENEFPWRFLSKRVLNHDPFISRIHGPITKKYEELFLDIEKIKIIGFSAEKVFLTDENGTIKVLSVGDKVAYGYLDYIDLENQFIQFKLNKIGLETTHKLYLEKE
ncbi:MAG: hypothetical protein KAS49_03400 [Candidatus Cloacimonetes bacterium]|nr:hypothetical protein [Candidatus Cloacimonadota bacterium]